MDKHDLSMADFYESFYEKTTQSSVFARYCEEVFGADFSQDGLSDLQEIDDLIESAGIHKSSAVLDLGCGNGGMCEYIHRQTGAMVHGFDYAKTAIKRAQERTSEYPALQFSVGVFERIEYPVASFDVILSVDTMYFVDDIQGFIRQIVKWLKPHGIFAVMYGSYDKIESSIDRDMPALAQAFQHTGYPYKVTDYTKNHFHLMKRKRKVAVSMAEDFRREGLEHIHNRILTESIDLHMTFDEFSQHFSRFMYIVQKN